MDDDTIRTLVKRLARPHPSGGKVIERAAILAEGPDSAAILAWIVTNAGAPEDLAPRAAGRGLHDTTRRESVSTGTRAPLRYVLPAGTLQ